MRYIANYVMTRGVSSGDNALSLDGFGIIWALFFGRFFNGLALSESFTLSQNKKGFLFEWDKKTT